MRRLEFLVLSAALAFSLAAAPAVTVKTADDLTLAATLTAIQDGKLILATKTPASATQPVVVALEDLVEMTVQDAAPSASNHPSTAPSMFRGELHLAGDDQFTDPITAWTEKTLVVQTAMAPSGLLNVPVARLREVWLAGKPVQVKQARALHPKPTLEDTVFALKDGQVLAVQGVVLGLEGNELHMRFNDEDRRVGLDHLIGVILGSPSVPPADTSFHQCLRLKSGATISGTCRALGDGYIDVQTPWGDALQIPLSEIASMRSVNGRLIYLSDLPCAAVEQVPYLDRIMPYQADQSLTGGPLQLSDGTYPKGIAVHARCVLNYDLLAQYESFRTKVGFQQPEGKVGRAVIRVLGDGKVLFEDADAHGDAPPTGLKLDVTGVSRLTLEVDFAKDQDDVGARVDWANARLLRAPTAPPK